MLTRNSAARATIDFKTLVETSTYLGRRRDAMIISWIMGVLRIADHYAIPNDQLLSTTDKKPVPRLVALDLPSQAMSVEFILSNGLQSPSLTLQPGAPAMLLMARVSGRKLMDDFGLGPKDFPIDDDCQATIGMFLTAVAGSKAWAPYPVFFYVPDGPWSDQFKLYELRGPSGAFTRVGFRRLLPDVMQIFESTLKAQNPGHPDPVIDAVMRDLGGAVGTAMDFCDIMGCSNILPYDIQNADEAVNKRRLAQGKVPLYTVQGLQVKSALAVPLGAPSGGQTSAPAPTPIRKGHIWRFGTGKKIWVPETFTPDTNPGLDQTH